MLDGGVFNIGEKRSLRINIFENMRHRIGDKHLAPHANAHRRALFGIYRNASQITLIQFHIHFVRSAEPSDKQSPPAELGPEKMKSRLFYHTDYVAEQYIEIGRASC